MAEKGTEGTSQTLTADDLRALGPFAGASEEELQALIEHGRQVRVPAGTVLMSQDDDSRSAALIVAGEVEVIRSGTTIATMGPGDAVGELGLVRGQKRTATVRASRDTTLLAYNQAGFQQVLDVAPTIAMHVLGQMRKRPLDTGGETGDPASPDDA